MEQNFKTRNLMMFTEQEIEKLIEQAYNNDIAEAGMARARSSFISDSKDYKSSTAYHELQIIRSIHV
jgi:hypothetical protein